MTRAVPWRAGGGGVLLVVRLTPKSSRDAVEGIERFGDGVVLKARVRAVPEAGKANRALEALMAEWLGVARSTVAVTAGETSRLKTLTLSGDAVDVLKRLDAKGL